MWSPASIPTLGPTWYSHCTDKDYEVLPLKQFGRGRYITQRFRELKKTNYMCLENNIIIPDQA